MLGRESNHCVALHSLNKISVAVLICWIYLFAIYI